MRVNEQTLHEMGRAWPLPSVPVIVISGTLTQPPVFTAARRRQMTALQAALSRRIPGAQHTEAAGCGHNIPGDCPAQVTHAVTQVLEQVAASHRKP